jgi:hypothetical protein
MIAALAAGGLCFTASAAERARPAPRLTPGVAQRIATLQGRVGPRSRAFIAQEAANVVVSGGFSLVRIRTDINDADLGVMGGGDIDALVQMVLLQAAIDAENDLRAQMTALQATINQKKAIREPVADARRSEQTLKALATTDARSHPIFVAPVYSLDSATGLTGLDDRIAADQDATVAPGALNELQPLRLQMVLDRRYKMLELISNLLKAAADTSAAITANLK